MPLLNRRKKQALSKAKTRKGTGNKKLDDSASFSDSKVIDNIDFFKHSDFDWDLFGNDWKLTAEKCHFVWISPVDKAGYKLKAVQNEKVFNFIDILSLEHAREVAEEWLTSEGGNLKWERDCCSEGKRSFLLEKQLELLKLKTEEN